MAFLRTNFRRSPISVVSCIFHPLCDPEPFTQRKSGMNDLGQCRDNLRESLAVVSAKAGHDGWAAIHTAVELVVVILIQPSDDGVVPPVADAYARHRISLHVIGGMVKNLLAFGCHVGKPDCPRKDKHAVGFCECILYLWLVARELSS